jgi:hypothetical protein
MLAVTPYSTFLYLNKVLLRWSLRTYSRSKTVQCIADPYWTPWWQPRGIYTRYHVTSLFKNDASATLSRNYLSETALIFCILPPCGRYLSVSSPFPVPLSLIQTHHQPRSFPHPRLPRLPQPPPPSRPGLQIQPHSLWSYFSHVCLFRTTIFPCN